NAITINDTRPFEAPTQIRLHRFLHPYEVIKPVDRRPVQPRVKRGGRPPPPPKELGVTGTTRTSTLLLPVFTSVRPPLDPAPADAAQFPNGAVLPDEIHSVDLPPTPGQEAGRAASQNLSPQALSVIAGALAGAAFG